MKIINRGSFFILFFIIHLFADRYNFKLICNKQKIYLGEEFKIEFRFSYDNASKIAEVNFSPPLFQNLHIKEQNQTQTDFSQSWIYILSAFKDKNISIPKAYLDIAIKKDTNKTLGHFDDYDYDYITLETKPLALKILQNHDKTNLYGKFDINSTIKKENNIIYLTINISGEGNFEDIGEYKLNIKNATIYSNKPIYKNNLYQQNFAIVSDQSFTIPSFEISYIDKKNNKKITKKTKPIFIKIDNKNNKKT